MDAHGVVAMMESSSSSPIANNNSLFGRSGSKSGGAKPQRRLSSSLSPARGGVRTSPHSVHEWIDHYVAHPVVASQLFSTRAQPQQPTTTKIDRHPPPPPPPPPPSGIHSTPPPSPRRQTKETASSSSSSPVVSTTPTKSITTTTAKNLSAKRSLFRPASTANRSGISRSVRNPSNNAPVAEDDEKHLGIALAASFPGASGGHSTSLLSIPAIVEEEDDEEENDSNAKKHKKIKIKTKSVSKTNRLGIEQGEYPSKEVLAATEGFLLRNLNQQPHKATQSSSSSGVFSKQSARQYSAAALLPSKQQEEKPLDNVTSHTQTSVTSFTTNTSRSTRNEGTLSPIRSVRSKNNDSYEPFQSTHNQNPPLVPAPRLHPAHFQQPQRNCITVQEIEAPPLPSSTPFSAVTLVPVAPATTTPTPTTRTTKPTLGTKTNTMPGMLAKSRETFRKVRIKESKVLWTKPGSRAHPAVPTGPPTTPVTSQSVDTTTASNSESHHADAAATIMSPPREVSYKVYLLLLQPESKIFELIQLFYNPHLSTIRDILHMVPSHATESALASQTYTGLIRPKRRATPWDDLDLIASVAPPSPQHGGTIPMRSMSLTSSSSASVSGRNAGIRDGEILVAMPYGYTARHMINLAKQILANPRIQKLLEKSHASDAAAAAAGHHHHHRHHHKRQSGMDSKRGSRRLSMEIVQEESLENTLLVVPNNNNNNSTTAHSTAADASSSATERDYEEGMKRALENAAVANAETEQLLDHDVTEPRRSTSGSVSSKAHTQESLDTYLAKNGATATSRLNNSGPGSTTSDHYSVASSTGSRRPVVNGYYDEDGSLEGSYLSWAQSVDSSVVSRSRLRRYRPDSPTSQSHTTLASAGGAAATTTTVTTSASRRRVLRRARNKRILRRLALGFGAAMLLRYYLDPAGYAATDRSNSMTALQQPQQQDPLNAHVNTRRTTPRVAPRAGPSMLAHLFSFVCTFFMLVKMQLYVQLNGTPPAESKCPFLQTSMASLVRWEQGKMSSDRNHPHHALSQSHHHNNNTSSSSRSLSGSVTGGSRSSRRHFSSETNYRMASSSSSLTRMHSARTTEAATPRSQSSRFASSSCSPPQEAYAHYYASR